MTQAVQIERENYNNSSYFALKEKIADTQIEKALFSDVERLVNNIFLQSNTADSSVSVSFKDYLVKELMELVGHVIYYSNKGYYSQEISFESGNINILSKNSENPSREDLIKKLVMIIESHIDDECLNMNMVCKSMCMSRTSLYNKVKRQTGKSVSDFIRNIRLKKAAYLLSYEHLNVTEAMFRVGINSPSYFSRFFKKEFGIAPSQFAKAKHGLQYTL